MRKKNDFLRFDAQGDTYFLMDRIIHDISIDGRRVIELYRDQNKETLTADEQKLLGALADSYYSFDIDWGSYDYLTMREEIEDLFQRPVDVVEEGTVRNPIKRRCIEENKEVIYESGR